MEFNFFVPYVIPENYWVSSNDFYTADISYTNIDTTNNPKGIIGSDSIYFIRSVSEYKFIPSEIGNYKNEGKILIPSPATGDLLTFPFDVEFKVTRNEN